MKSSFLIKLSTISALIGMVLLSCSVYAKEVQIERNIPANQWSAARLSNLPAGAKLAIRISTDKPIKIALTDQTFEDANVRREPIFLASIDGELIFPIEVPEAGDYYLILDNREGKNAVSALLEVEAIRTGNSADEILDNFEAALHKIFIFEPIDIQARNCNIPNAYSTRDGNIILCIEYVEKLQQEIGDSANTRDVLVFALFHEVGHTLLRQWNTPFYEDEEVADQFAVATLLMLNQQSRIEAVVDLFSSRSRLTESLARALNESRYPLSGDRANNISRWIGDPDFLNRWQTVLIPHMQTPYMKKLLTEDVAWIDAEAMQNELDERKRQTRPE